MLWQLMAAWKLKVWLERQREGTTHSPSKITVGKLRHAATGGGSVDEEDAIDVDAVAVDGGTEAEGVARAPARRDDAFPIKN
jgi:hypothetical protein